MSSIYNTYDRCEHCRGVDRAPHDVVFLLEQLRAARAECKRLGDLATANKRHGMDAVRRRDIAESQAIRSLQLYCEIENINRNIATERDALRAQKEKAEALLNEAQGFVPEDRRDLIEGYFAEKSK